jgi:hypothetical protein
MKTKTNTPPGWLERQARKLIKKQGYFLLAYDVIRSRDYIEEHGYDDLSDTMEKFHKEMNEKHKDHFIGKPMGKMPPRHEPRIVFGFTGIKGDAGVAFLKNSEPIRDIVAYVKENLPFKVRWATARDEWDGKLKTFV